MKPEIPIFKPQRLLKNKNPLQQCRGFFRFSQILVLKGWGKNVFPEGPEGTAVKQI